MFKGILKSTKQNSLASQHCIHHNTHSVNQHHSQQFAHEEQKAMPLLDILSQHEIKQYYFDPHEDVSDDQPFYILDKYDEDEMLSERTWIEYYINQGKDAKFIFQKFHQVFQDRDENLHGMDEDNLPLYVWTLQEPAFYKLINSYLRGSMIPRSGYKKSKFRSREFFRSYVKLLNRALINQDTRYIDKVDPGTVVFRKGSESLIPEKNSIYENKIFWATSKNINITKAFDGNILFVITTNKYSKCGQIKTSQFNHEEEVLFANHQNFYVHDVLTGKLAQNYISQNYKWFYSLYRNNIEYVVVLESIRSMMMGEGKILFKFRERFPSYANSKEEINY